MKYKLMYLLAAAGLLLAALVFLRLDQGTQTPRYHQHLEQPGEAELGTCADCGGQGDLCTHLPILRIETGGQKIPGAAILDKEFRCIGYETGPKGEEMISASLSSLEQEGRWHHPDDAPDLTATALVRCRGNTSRSFSKHSYLLKLIQDRDPLQNRALPLLGMDAHHEWALHGPFLDKTLIRNYMWMNISAEVMGYGPEVRFCELILDGVYQGVYVLMETIAESEARVDLTDYAPGDPVCSYIVRIGGNLDPAKAIDTFYHKTLRLAEGKQIEILYPTRLDQTQQVHDYINADLSEIERLLVSVNMNDHSRLYQDYLDVDSFVNYYILQEFLLVNDAFSESTYFHRDVRGKLHMGPVWDYNNVLDNFLRPVPRDQFLLAQRGWYGQLMQDEVFVKKVIARYRALRQDVLSDQRLNGYLDQTIAWLGAAIDRNYDVWGHTFDLTDLSRVEYRRPPVEDEKALPEAESEDALRQMARPYNPRDYAEAVSWMRTAMQERGAWMDAHIESLLQHCADSKNATRIVD